MIREDVKKFVEGATYCQMLSKQRFCPAGDPFFQMDDETWTYWKEQFNIKRAATGDNGVSDSKALGW
jgi:hypothetical protein